MAHQQTLLSRNVRRFLVGRYGPSWRWRCALAPGDQPFAVRQDREIAQAADYVRRKAADPRQAELRYPEIAAADQLRDVEVVVELLQLLSLARIAADEIARRAKLPVRYVSLWQRLFFDLSAGDYARDWVSVHVLHPMMAIKPLLAVKMRLAFFGGPNVTNAILEAETGYSDDHATQLAALRIRYGLELEAALDEIFNASDDPERRFQVALKGWLAITDRLNGRHIQALQQGDQPHQAAPLGAEAAGAVQVCGEESKRTAGLSSVARGCSCCLNEPGTRRFAIYGRPTLVFRLLSTWTR